MKFYHLNRQQLHDWAARCYPRHVVGYTHYSGCCPLAHATEDLLGFAPGSVHVEDEAIRVTSDGEPIQVVADDFDPYWIYRAVDGLSVQPGREVTAEEFLAILDREVLA